MNFVEKLQQKPKKTRVTIMWLASVCVTLIIIVIWLIFSQTNTNNEDAKNSLNKSGLPSLFESFKKDFSDLKNTFSSGIKSLKDQEAKLEELNEGQKTE